MKALYHLIAIYLSILVLSTAIVGCKQDCEIPDDPACPNYDPCWEKDPVSAAFDMWEVMPNDSLLEVQDAVFMNRTLVLEARQSDLESYSWRIGQDTTIRTGPSTEVYFGAPYSAIDITLMVSSTADLSCNPDDNGRDTITRSVNALRLESLPIWGAYQGVENAEPTAVFTMTLGLDTTQFGLRAYMQNLPRECTRILSIIAGANGFEIESNGTADCLQVEGFARLSPGGDSLTVRYRRQDRDRVVQSPPDYDLIDSALTFVGVRQ